MARQKSKDYQKTEHYKKSVLEGQKQWRDSLYGEGKKHIKVCENCKKEFTWFGRKGTTGFKKARFCSLSCANSRAEYWKVNATRYQTIAFNNHEKKCIVCGFDKIVAVHHYDHNRKNNHPSNLIPLCPNHHEMIHHSLYKSEVEPIVDEWKNKLPRDAAGVATSPSN